MHAMVRARRPVWTEERGERQRASDEGRRDAVAEPDTRRSEAEAQGCTEAGYDEWSSYPASVVTAIRSSG